MNLITALKRALLAWRIAGWQGELNETRERFYADCERLSVLRSRITAAQHHLDALDGRHKPNVYQLRGRYPH